MKRSVGEIERDFAHNTFSARLLELLSKSYDGKQRTTLYSLSTLGDGAPGHSERVLDARFAMGANNGAYLRSNVMPLHSAEKDNKIMLSRRTSTDVDASGRAGVIEALQDDVKQKTKQKLEAVKPFFGLVAYLLTIPEVYEFVSNQLTLEQLDEAQPFVSALSPNAAGADRTTAVNSFADVKGVEDAMHKCEVVRVVLAMLEHPLALVEQQLEKTIGQNGTGTTQVWDGINRLSLAARATAQVYESDKYPVNSAATVDASVGAAVLAAAAEARGDDPPPLESSFLRGNVSAVVRPRSPYTNVLRRTSSTGTFGGLLQSLSPALRNDNASLNPTLPDAFKSQLKAQLDAELSKDGPSEIEDKLKSGAFGLEIRRKGYVGYNPLSTLVKGYVEDLEASRDSTMSKEQAEKRFNRAKAILASYTDENAEFIKVYKQVVANFLTILKDDPFISKENLTKPVNLDKLASITQEKFQKGLFYPKSNRHLYTAVSYAYAMFKDQTAQAIALQQGIALPPLDNTIFNQLKAIDEDLPDLVFADPPPSPPPTAGPSAVPLTTNREDSEGEDDSGKGVGEVESGKNVKLWQTLDNEAEALRREAEAKRKAAINPEVEEEDDPNDFTITDVEEEEEGAVTAKGSGGGVVVRKEGGGGESGEKGGKEGSAGDAAFRTTRIVAAGVSVSIPGLLQFFANRSQATPELRATSVLDVCVDPVPIDTPEREKHATNALCAATSQLREDGGVESDFTDGVERIGGISPFWDAHERPSPRDEAVPDFWSRTLWPTTRDGYIDPVVAQPFVPNLHVRLDSLGTQSCQMAKGRLKDGNQQERSLLYSVVRGLCAYRGPHQYTPAEDTVLLYSKPSAAFVSKDVLTKAAEGGAPVPESTQEEAAAKSRKRAFCNATLRPVDDFVTQQRNTANGNQAYEERPMLVQWAPVHTVNLVGAAANGSRPVRARPQLDDGNVDNQDVALAAVHEHLVDYYRSKSQERLAAGAGAGDPDYVLALGCMGAAKVRQLKSMARVSNALKRNSELCNAFPEEGPDGGKDVHFFVTRPVLRCPELSSVLYPCDAGFSGWYKAASAVPGTASEEEMLEFDEALGAVASDGSRREVVKRNMATRSMRSLIHRRPASGQPATQPPLYVGPAVGRGGAGDVNDRAKRFTLRNPQETLYCADEPDLMDVHRIVSALKSGIQMCKELHQLDCETKYVERMHAESKADAPSDHVDMVARSRREAVWDDASREAAISGDRLYSFVRQLSGTISENVDAVCQIDEGQLVRQQQQLRERRSRAADQAAREHMTLVRNVFSSVLRDSGLTLGISDDNDVGQLKVVAGNLRKQATQLTQNAPSSEGFFSNAVRLEQLLSKGTGELTIKQLFDRLQEAGTALQDAALSAHSDGVPGSSASLDFLSAPRNSLILRYKSDSLAAIRQAFDVFQREMVTTGNAWRTISAFELVEGNDEQLCTAFATFSAHMLVHSRMYSSATALYIAAWPAAANAQQMKISLQRLVRVAANYLAHQRAPSFTTAGGREQYFSQDTPPPGGSPPYMMGPRFGPQRGLWGLNMYGNR